MNLSKQCSLCSFVASPSAAHSLMSTTCGQLQLPSKQRVREIEGEREHTQGKHYHTQRAGKKGNSVPSKHTEQLALNNEQI